VRDAKKGEPWAARGCEVANARMNDSNALAQAFEGAHGVFILLPPQFDPSPGFPETREVIEAVVKAVRRAKPRKIVCLSTIGAQAKETNLLTQHTLLQDALIAQPIPVTFLRPGWFMENSAWDVQSAREEGVVHSFLQPLDRAIPMVATEDVGRTAARLLMDDSHGTRVIELEGPQRVSPHDIAAAFSAVLGKPVTAQAVPRESWRDMFEQQGMKNPMPRIRMLDGFNEGWIDFEGPSEDIVKGEVDIESVVRKLCA
jgi:uncharacterized protein YbjT (DUF2867 family)